MSLKTLFVASSLVIAAGCASKEVVRSDVAPAAGADISASRAPNDNTKLKVDVKHLAEPERLAVDAKQYIVWITPAGSDTPLNVGALKVDDNLKGKLETTVPYDQFKVTVTPEQERVASEPSGPVIFEKFVKR